jgi:alpha-methylacyl-CoA racemase
MSKRSGPLVGVKILELSGIGPAPLCCALLSDMGADILRIDRNSDPGLGLGTPAKADLGRRGRYSVSVDMKHPKGIATVKRLIAEADAVIDPFRPGVAEKLGIGPEDCKALNKRLVYGRMTGWGQTGPLAKVAGHDLNYLAITGVLNAIGSPELPLPPLNLVADMGGGAMFLAVGILSAILEARSSGEGQTVDVSMVEGSSFLALSHYGMVATKVWNNERGTNFTDGGAHFYRCYRTKDGKYVSIASIEAKFYALLLDKIGLDPKDLPPQMDRSTWADMSKRFEAIFAEKTRDEWCAIMEGTDICFAPVLTFEEAAKHPHNKARGSYVEVAGITQPGPAPRFSRTPSAITSPPPEMGSGTREGLASWGFDESEIDALLAEKAVGWQG